MRNKTLKRRIVDIAYKNKASHIGSCLTAVDIINEIYKNMNKDDVFILSQGHAGLALYVVLEKYKYYDAEELFEKHGTHPNADTDILCSSGSLGHGLPIGIGYALALPDIDVYVLTSDGEWAEGSMEESLRIIREVQHGEHKSHTLDNLKVYVNINGYGAYREINKQQLQWKLANTNFYLRDTSVEQLPFLKGISAHYHVMDRHDYDIALEYLS